MKKSCTGRTFTSSVRESRRMSCYLRKKSSTTGELEIPNYLHFYTIYIYCYSIYSCTGGGAFIVVF